MFEGKLGNLLLDYEAAERKLGAYRTEEQIVKVEIEREESVRKLLDLLRAK